MRVKNKTPRVDLETEEALIGACLLSPAAVKAAKDACVRPSDFFDPKNQHIWAAILALDVDRVDVVTVNTELGPLSAEAGGLVRLLELQNMTPAVSAAPKYARVVADLGRLRELQIDLSQAVDAGFTADDPDDLIARVSKIVERPVYTDGAVLSMSTWDDILPDTDRDVRQPAIFPGLLRVRQRVMVVAPAGVGKSTLLRMLAVCAQNGIHPWTLRPIKATKSHLMEFESSHDDITDSMTLVVEAVARAVGCNPRDLEPPHLLIKQSGYDLLDSYDFRLVSRELDRSGGEFVAMGPVKNMGAPRGGEGYDVFASHLQRAVNKLIEWHGCGVVLETHSNRSEPDKPAGSQRWIDWPDLGFSLVEVDDAGNTKKKIQRNPKAEQTFNVDLFRRPRDSSMHVPITLTRRANGDKQGLPWWAAFEQNGSYAAGGPLDSDPGF